MSEHEADQEAMPPGAVVALAAMGLAVFVIANDFTALSVALPNVEQDFSSDVTSVQWVINAYALVFGVLIVTGGRLADIFGRRRAFFVGAAIFAVFSALGGAAPNVGWLIATRALMGVGGALMWPAVLGMTYALLPKRKAGLAGGLILGIAGVGNAFGPMLGGVLTDALSWRWVLFLNVPIAALACLATYVTVHEPAKARAGGEHVDYPGSAVLSLALVSLLVALDQSTDWGFADPRTLILLVLFAVFLAAFVLVERRAGAGALLPPDVMRNSQFSAACLAVLLLSATFFATLIYLPQYMQKLLDYSALRAGVGLLPMMGVFAVVSLVAGSLYGRVGAKPIVCAGAACMAAGVFVLSLVGSDAGYWSLVPGMAAVGVGVGLFYATVTTAAVTLLDSARTSLAGGIVYMCQIAGGSVGLGLTTTIFTAQAQATVHGDRLAGRLSADQEQSVTGLLAGTDNAHELLAQFPAQAAHLEALAREAFASGMQTSFRVVAALGLLALLVSLRYVGGSLRGSREPAPAVQPDAAGSP